MHTFLQGLSGLCECMLYSNTWDTCCNFNCMFQIIFVRQNNRITLKLSRQTRYIRLTCSCQLAPLVAHTQHSRWAACATASRNGRAMHGTALHVPSIGGKNLSSIKMYKSWPWHDCVKNHTAHQVSVLEIIMNCRRRYTIRLWPWPKTKSERMIS